MDIKILIVDDTLFMRHVLRGIVEEEGWTVVGEASNGVEAVEMFRILGPDITTMDIVMPLKSGIDALAEIMTDYPDARVIMCSALGQEGLVEEARKAGAKGYITKPFEADQVKDVIRGVAGL